MKNATNYLCQVLQQTLEVNEEVKVEFGNEEDNIYYILDVVKLFRENLLSTPDTEANCNTCSHVASSFDESSPCYTCTIEGLSNWEDSK